MAFTPVQKLSITSGAAMVLLSAVGIVAYLSTSQLVDAQNAAAQTNSNIARLDRVVARTEAAEIAIRRYVRDRDASAMREIEGAQNDVEYALDSLTASSEDHPIQRRSLDSLATITGGRFREIRQVLQVHAKRGRDSASALLGSLRPGPGAGRLLAEMRAEEVRVLGERTRLMAESAKFTRTLIVAGSIFALLLALIALQPLRSGVERRLTERLSQTFETVSKDDDSPA